MMENSLSILTVGFFWTILLAAFVQQTSAGNILAVPVQMTSHMIYLNSVGEGLVNRGHNVYTVVGSHFKDSFVDNIKGNGLQVLRYKTPESADTFISDKFQEIIMDIAINGTSHEDPVQILYEDCEYMLQDKNMMKKMTDIKFDIAIVDDFLLGPCGFLIPHVLGVPYVSVSSSYSISELGVPALPSFVPNELVLMSDNMNFLQRVQHTWLEIVRPVVRRKIFPTEFNYTLLDKYAKDKTLKTWYDMRLKSEIFLYTKGPLLEWPAPSMPYFVYMDCVTCKSGKPLTGELGEFVNSATGGVILVTFGSMIGFTPSWLNEKLLKAFSLRKEAIIWKVSSHMKVALENQVPSNVKMTTWIPQNDLLAHPNVKVFVTHCGNNGQYESLYHGVPMLGMPIFAEQPRNAFRMETHEYGKLLDIMTFTPKDFSDAIEDLVTNPKYQKNVQKVSKILHHNPLMGKDLGAYWVEHVMKFGSDHLKSPAMTMPWYSYYLFDVFLFSAAILVGLICLIWYLLKQILKLLCRKGTSKKIKTK